MNSRITSQIISAATVVALAGALSVPFAAAEISTVGSISVDGSTSVGSGKGKNTTAHAEVRATTQANNEAKAKTRADQEIKRRIDALTKLEARITAMKHVSDANKASLTSSIQTQISAMTSLQTKIDSETGSSTLKVDIQSITKSYRIFALIIPQGAIEAAADRILDVNTSMTAVSTKIQTRITEAQSEGKDITTLQSLLSDFNAKVTDSNIQAQAAVTLVAALTPDEGDQVKMEANTKALKTARADIKSGTQDLKAARQDAEKILQALKTMKVKASANATTSASQTTTVTH